MFCDYLRRTLAYHLNLPLAKPERVNLEITDRCPLNCKMCNIPKLKRDPQEELSLTELKRIVGEIKDWGVGHISLAGGETLVREEDTLKLLDHAQQLGLETELITNGYFIDQELADKLVATGIDRVSLSIDGAKKQTHDYIRGEGSFDRCIRAAQALKRCRSEGQPELEFTTVIMEPNRQELVDIWRLMRSQGFDFINYQALVPDNTFRGLSCPPDLWPSEEGCKQLDEELEKLIKIKEATGDIRNKKRYLRQVTDYFRQKEDFNPGNCMAGHNSLEINPYGEIDACGYLPKLSVRERSLREIWHSDEFKQGRKKIKNCEKPCMMLCYEKMSLMELFGDKKDALLSQKILQNHDS